MPSWQNDYGQNPTTLRVATRDTSSWGGGRLRKTISRQNDRDTYTEGSEGNEVQLGRIADEHIRATGETECRDVFLWFLFKRSLILRRDDFA